MLLSCHLQTYFYLHSILFLLSKECWTFFVKIYAECWLSYTRVYSDWLDVSACNLSLKVVLYNLLSYAWERWEKQILETGRFGLWKWQNGCYLCNKRYCLRIILAEMGKMRAKYMHYLAPLRINRVRIFPYVRYITELAVIKKATFMENFLRRKCLSEETFNLFNCKWREWMESLPTTVSAWLITATRLPRP